MQRDRSPRAEVYKLPWREERAPPKPGGVKFPSCILKRGARPVTPPARPSPPQAIRPGTLAPPNQRSPPQPPLGEGEGPPGAAWPDSIQQASWGPIPPNTGSLLPHYTRPV